MFAVHLKFAFRFGLLSIAIENERYNWYLENALGDRTDPKRPAFMSYLVGSAEGVDNSDGEGGE